MCLSTKWNLGTFKLKVAKKDIIVYKVFKKSNDNNNDLLSAFTNFRWKVNELMDANPYDKELFREKIKKYKFIGDGMFHTFKNKRDAKYLITLLEGIWGSEFDYTVYKCIIPKGTEYVKGYFFDDSYVIKPVNYGSFNLILKEEV